MIYNFGHGKCNIEGTTVRSNFQHLLATQTTTMSKQRQPVPPFDHQTALQKVQGAEDAWNTRNPEKVAQAYSEDSVWRNRDEFIQGRAEIEAFLDGKWKRELHYRLTKELWSYTDNRISVRFEYEWQHNETGQWYRTHGNEHWEFDADGYMSRRDMSANDISITPDKRRIGLPTNQQESPGQTPSVMNEIMKATIKAITILLFVGGLASTSRAQLPDPGVVVDDRTALVITDPQNDFLSPDGVTWHVVGESVTANNTVANLETLLKTAKEQGIPVFISPHYYYPTDHGWQFEGALEKLMHNIGMFDRSGPTDLTGFEGSGADWLERYKPYIMDGETVVTSPHKVFGPEQNDLALQLRKRGIDRVILAGMSGNLCVESHMRELLEMGFEVAVVTDATASAILPGLDGNAAAQTNYRFIANTTWTTTQAIDKMQIK